MPPGDPSGDRRIHCIVCRLCSLSHPGELELGRPANFKMNFVSQSMKIPGELDNSRRIGRTPGELEELRELSGELSGELGELGSSSQYEFDCLPNGVLFLHFFHFFPYGGVPMVSPWYPYGIPVWMFPVFGLVFWFFWFFPGLT